MCLCTWLNVFTWLSAFNLAQAFCKLGMASAKIVNSRVRSSCLCSWEEKITWPISDQTDEAPSNFCVFHIFLNSVTWCQCCQTLHLFGDILSSCLYLIENEKGLRDRWWLNTWIFGSWIDEVKEQYLKRVFLVVIWHVSCCPWTWGCW